MLQHTQSALVGTKFVTAAPTAVGDILFHNEEGQVVTAANAADALYIIPGVVRSLSDVVLQDGTVQANTPLIEWGQKIYKNVAAVYTQSEYVAPVQSSIVIDLSGVDAANASGLDMDKTYTLRIAYKDIYEYPGLYTFTAYANGVTNAAELGAAWVREINLKKGRRVNASLAGTTLTITALEKTDNDGVWSINEYSIVEMTASAYVVDPRPTWAYSQEAMIPGLSRDEITINGGEPGVGYWKQVRDREMWAAGYKGHIFNCAYPRVEGQRHVVEGAEYETVTTSSRTPYVSPNNTYDESTPVTNEIFSATTGDAALIAAVLDAYGIIEQERP